MTQTSILWVDDISVSFDGFRALNHLSLQLEPGELRCVIGPNGAGKSTMMDVITGKTRPDEGHVYLFGRTLDLITKSESQIAELGVGRKFQRPTVFENLTVFQNLELALKAKKSVWRTLVAQLNGEQRDRIGEVLDTIHLGERAHSQAGLLAHGQKQWLEIGMLLVQDPKVLLVDEPVAGMTHREMDHTAELLRDLAGEHTVVVVEHDMDFVRNIAKKVTVLHEGSVIAEGSMDEVQNHPKVIEVYLGSEAAAHAAEKQPTAAEVGC